MVCRYSGYCAWRGVVTDSEAPEAAAAVRKAYSEMGAAIYFEIAEGTHGVLYELPRQRLNWLWYAVFQLPSCALGFLQCLHAGKTSVACWCDGAPFIDSMLW